jgi:quercetin dioxygenase-like cupin family protein
MTDQVTREGAPGDDGRESAAPSAVQGYSPSPRPSFDKPTAITRETVTRHLWGDDVSGCVSDLIYASTERIHGLVFSIPAGGSFEHSQEFLTVFGADELLEVLSGTMVLANPETGEVERIPAGKRVFFRKDTWHHAFAHGNEPLRVLEIFAPPPAAGASGAYARTRPYLQTSYYADERVLGALPSDERPPRTLRVLGDSDVVWRRDLGVLCGVLVSTEHLTVHTLEINPGEVASVHRHGGDELLYVTEGTLWVRAWQDTQPYVFELDRDDACLIPAGCEHEYRSHSDQTVHATIGVAPKYAP